jgi:hypothetical protein
MVFVIRETADVPRKVFPACRKAKWRYDQQTVVWDPAMPA